MTHSESFGAVVERLHDVIEARKAGDPSTSYTASLFAEGTARISRKLGEEAIETVIACLQRDRSAVIAESADLLYHLLVVWSDSGIQPDEVGAELARREGVSGLREKAARGPGNEL